MNWRDLAKNLAGVAPAVGTALAGPAGAVVGAALAERLGVPATPAAVQEAIRVDPEAERQIREFAQALTVAEMQDVKEARQQLSGAWWGYVVDAVVLLTFVGLGASLIFVEVPEGNQRAFDLFLGAVLGFAGAIITFWRGSSRGSAEKSQTIERKL